MRIASLIILLFFTGCATREQVMNYDKEQLDSYAFNVDKKSVLKNPPKDKARIYFVREDSFVGMAAYYSYYIHFASVKKSTLAGYLKNGWAFYVDIAPDRKILITTEGHLGSLGNEDCLTSFVPESGKIYCLDKEMRLLDRSKCERVWAEYIEDKNREKVQEEQREYLGEYLSDKNNSLLSQELILRSFDKRKSKTSKGKNEK